MKTQFLPFLFILLLTACGRGKFIDYGEKLEGTWQLNNAPDVLKSGDALNYSADELRKSTLIFMAGGKLLTEVGNDKNDGKWEVSADGTRITLLADNVRFGESLPLSFENERTIIITNTGKKFIFKKISE